jgi:cation diffusion facilitator CzcD-associated flavoprotein CzcO
VSTTHTDFEVIIVGTGFAGLGMAINLQKAGIHSFVLLERAEEVGGTWRDNNYPGCACDIQSHMYSFSFELNPNWSRKYPQQKEIKRYLERCAEHHGLGPHIRFGQEVTGATWDNKGERWRVDTADGTALTARFMVSAIGGLSRPAFPDIQGLDDFEGAVFHSAQWDHGFDLKGKRVAVIGTGASAIQFLPQIAPDVARLDLYQRTAPWIIPRPDRAFKAWEKALLRTPLIKLYRGYLYCFYETRALTFLGNTRAQAMGNKMAGEHLEAQVTDPALRAKVTPDYQMGCKRVLISNDYYPALQRRNVEVITEGIREIRAHSVVDQDGREREVDAIILGTGFQATDPLGPVEIRGTDGAPLTDLWEDGIEGYLGTIVAGFPNLFMLAGPNTGLGHNSMVFMLEAQIHYVIACLEGMKTRGWTRLALRDSAQTTFNTWLQAQMGKTVWASGCKSWYLDKNGKNVTLWPGFTFDFWRQTRKPTFAHFEGGAQQGRDRILWRDGPGAQSTSAI